MNRIDKLYEKLVLKEVWTKKVYSNDFISFSKNVGNKIYYVTIKKDSTGTWETSSSKGKDGGIIILNRGGSKFMNLDKAKKYMDKM